MAAATDDLTDGKLQNIACTVDDSIHDCFPAYYVKVFLVCK